MARRRKKSGNYSSSKKDYNRDASNTTINTSILDGDSVLTKDFADLNFYNPIGVDLDISGKVPTWTEGAESVRNVLRNFHVPGIMVFDVLSGPGTSTSGTSAINIASRNLFTYMRNKKNGQFPFEHQDATMFVCAMDAAFSLFTEICRTYRTLLLYSGTNRYLPRVLVEAMGYDYLDLTSHIKDLKGILDLFTYKLRTLYVPANYRIINRHFDLYKGVFADEHSSKAQLYLYRAYGFHVWQENIDPEDPDNKMGYCKYFQRHELASAATGQAWDPVDLWTFDAIEKILNYVYDSLMNSEDIASINGYMLAVYGVENCVTLNTSFDAVEPLQVTFDFAALEQIHNATIMPHPVSSASCDITTNDEINKGWLIWNPKFQVIEQASDNYLAKYFYYGARIMDSKDEHPDANAVARNSRFMVMPLAETIDERKITYSVELGADTLVNASIYTKLSPNAETEYSVTTFRYAGGFDTNTISKISMFDYAPIVVVVGVTGTTLTSASFIGELNNYTSMEVSDLKKIKMADTTYLWNVTDDSVPQ